MVVLHAKKKNSKNQTSKHDTSASDWLEHQDKFLDSFFVIPR